MAATREQQEESRQGSTQQIKRSRECLRLKRARRPCKESSKEDTTVTV
jgi:hypothetical protein